MRLDIVEDIISPKTIGDVATPETLTRLQAKLLAGVGSSKKKERSPHTVRSYMLTLMAALNWGHKMNWLPERVSFEILATDDPDKGRPITTEEFERMLAAVESVCTVGPAAWRFYLRGLWESGLRLGESLRLSWDVEGAIQPVFPSRGLPLPRHPRQGAKEPQSPRDTNGTSVRRAAAESA